MDEDREKPRNVEGEKGEGRREKNESVVVMANMLIIERWGVCTSFSCIIKRRSSLDHMDESLKSSECPKVGPLSTNLR